LRKLELPLRIIFQKFWLIKLLAIFTIFKLKPSEDIFNGLNKLEDIVIVSKFQKIKSGINDTQNPPYSTYNTRINEGDSIVETKNYENENYSERDDLLKNTLSSLDHSNMSNTVVIKSVIEP
jgi:hypothetical protein